VGYFEVHTTTNFGAYSLVNLLLLGELSKTNSVVWICVPWTEGTWYTCIYRLSVGKILAKRPFRLLRRRCEGNVKMIHREYVVEDGNTCNC
jgi:hypothetical protein